MPDKIKLPIAGEVDKKTATIAGIAVVGVVGIAYYRHKKAASTATAAADTGVQTDPAGNTGQIDPQTGFVYGSPEDQSALGNAGGVFPFGGNSGGSGGTSGTTATPTLTIAEWIANAENDLNAPSIQTIAPKILAGIPVSSADKNVFLEAVAVEGQPPGGYPTPIKLTDTGGHPGPGPAPEKVTVPVTFGMRANEAISKIEAEGLSVSTSPARNPAREYKSAGSSPRGGAKVDRGSHVTLNVRAA